MANSIITVPGLEIFTAEIEESCPIIEDTRSTQEGLKGRQGGKLKVAIPDPGKTFVKKGGVPTIGAGADIENTDVKEFYREFTVSVATNAATISSLEKVTDIDSANPASTPTPPSWWTVRATASTATASSPTWLAPSQTPAAPVNSSDT